MKRYNKTIKIMAEKKKFEKPEMQVIKLNTQMRMLAGSGCGEDCSWVGCGSVEICDTDQVCYTVGV